MTYEYIIYKDRYFVPRAPSMCEARERNEIFLEHLGVEPFIVSPLEWELLSVKVETLTFEVPNV